MKIIKLSEILNKTHEIYGENLLCDKFYDISSETFEIDTPDGFSKILSLVKKRGYDSIVKLENGIKVECSDRHLLKTPFGAIQVRNLNVGDDVIGKTFISAISSITISEEEKDFYDLEVENDTHLYYTSDGVCHHNTGKTHSVEKVLSSVGLNDGNGYFKNTGSSSAAGLYSLMFRYSDSILLFDDSDDTLGDQTSRNLIKAATDTKPRRKLNWAKRGSNVVEPDEYESHDELLDDGKIPRYFYFTGKIIFISNLNPDRLDPDGALRTRAFLIDINPTDPEIYDFMDKIVDKVSLPDGLSLATEDRKHVVELLRQGKSKQTANLRKLVRGLSMYAGAKAAGTSVSDEEMNRMIAMYA